jgi:hypothetical protein
MNQTRREFLATAGLAVGALSLAGCAHPRPPKPAVVSQPSNEPWYRRTLRWGQTNISEADPSTYDIGWWRDYWRQTRVQGVIVNAGGIVTYYPSRIPLQYRASTLGNRDLFGELVQAAHTDGLAVLARMDSSKAHDSLYDAHPGWFAIDAKGTPHKAGELFITCINSPYYDDYLPEVLREIAQRYHPEGFTDNSWSGLGRDSICYCENCARRFREKTGKSLPTRKNWDDAAYREWITWNYARRIELWDWNNRVTREAGGSNCLWIGMNSGSIVGQCQSFRDYHGICARTEMLLLDHQARGGGSFSQNAEAGQLIHNLLGWSKLVPESMAMYQAGRPTFRKTSVSAPEARLWILEGVAGGLQPWWHHIGAQQEDRRQFVIAESIYLWHEANEEFLINREPVANVGLVWSQKNTDFFGRDHPNEIVEQPWRGWAQALVRARIPFLPIHTDDLAAQQSQLCVLILPNLGALSDAQAANVRRFVQAGGALICTGRTGLFDEWGQPREDFALADLLGCHYVALGRESERPREAPSESIHTYLRIEKRGPLGQLESVHPVLKGFDQTEILPFGGWLGDVVASQGASVLLTFIPAFPVYPPETSWMREPRTHIPGLVLNAASAGRVAFLIADLDRRYAIDGLPDHGNLLANLVQWAANDRFPVQVDGPGLIDCHVYRQKDRFLVHLVNLTTSGGSRGPIDEVIPVGPVTVSLAIPDGFDRRTVRLRVRQEKNISTTITHGQIAVTLPSLFEHELIVLG